MPDDPQWALQKALYTKLSQDVNLTALLTNGADDIFDHVPEDSAVPYVVFRLASVQKIGTKTGDLLQVSVLIETYDDGKGMKTGTQIAAAISATLDQADITANGYTIIDCRFEQQNTKVFEGGLRRKVSQTFKIIMESE